MPSFALRLTVLIFLGAWIAPALAATSPPGNTDPHPPLPPPVNDSCVDQLTRAPDFVITLSASNPEPHETLTIVPTATFGHVDIAHRPCSWRVIEINVPANSLGCSDLKCYAEINVCAGKFSGGVSGFEKYCSTPISSTPENKCKSFLHQIEVYKKAAGQTAFATKPLATFAYHGFIANNQCRVAANTNGAIHNYDTAEVYPNAKPPTSGTDVYRVLSNPTFNGITTPTVVFIGVEPGQ